MPLSEASFSIEKDERSLPRRLTQRLAKPALILTAIAAIAALLAQFAPEPATEQERAERCVRLMSGEIELGDVKGAERMLGLCDMPRAEAEQLLDARWRRRWRGEPPPSVVQGVATRSEYLVGEPLRPLELRSDSQMERF